MATVMPAQKLQPIPEIGRVSSPIAAEFFAGIGLVRLGLESVGFDVVWSNDLEPAKREMYAGHFRDDPQGHTFRLGDVADVKGSAIPTELDLAWASFPCTDLSVAGWRRGLEGKHSSTFWHFTRVLQEMGAGRPSVVALENVTGMATSRGGEDLVVAIRELNSLGYSVDVLTLDARRFLPQSRPRLFIVGSLNAPAQDERRISALRPDWLQAPFNDPSLVTHRAVLPDPPPLLTSGLSEQVQRIDPMDSRWWDDARREAFVSSLSPIQLERLEHLVKGRTVSYRTAYRRTRHGVAVWEIRADDVAGCLRTARGGSSKQAIVKAGRGEVSVRWMTPREYARLMGAGEYRLGGLRTNQALFGFGDAVCVPVVSWLARNYLMPLVQEESRWPTGSSLAAIGA